jgi:RNA polymerase sigma factor for flagellar operon FliA
LLQSGTLGLLEAATRFDPERGAAFAVYAQHRIEGEMLEHLRSLDWVSRSVRMWGRRLAHQHTRLTGQLGREPSSGELAQGIDVSLDDYYRITHLVSGAKLISLEEVLAPPGDDRRTSLIEPCQTTFPDPLPLLQRKEQVKSLTHAIQSLPERERRVITLYYYEDLTLREIATTLLLTEGRISQIHSQALARLRGILETERRPHLTEQL